MRYRSCPVFGVDFLTPQGHPRSNLTMAIDSPWVLRISAPGVQHRICHRFRDISSQNFDDNLLNLIGLTPGPTSTKRETTYNPPRSTILQNFTTIAKTVYEICVTKVFHLLALGLTLRPKFTKRGDYLTAIQLCHPTKFHHHASTHARDTFYQKSCRQTDKQNDRQ